MEQSYPDREHRKTPKNAFDVISSELRLYPDGGSFREALVGLNRMYKDTEYATSLQEHAIKAASAHALINGDSFAIETSKNMLYSGSIFGLHAQLAPLPLTLKRFVIDSIFSLELQPGENESLESLTARRAAHYIDYSESIGSKSQSLNDHQQMLLMSAAERACDGYGSTYEDYFVEGILTSTHGVQSIVDYHRHHRG